MNYAQIEATFLRLKRILIITKIYHMKSKFILLFLLLTTYFSQAQMRYFYANLEGSQEVPASGSTATGVALIREE